MNSQTSRSRGWRRSITGAVAGGALAAGLLVGVGVSPAAADPVTDTASGSEDVPAPQMTADEALSIIAQDYDTGAGGGQLSNLISDVLKLRSQGFMPSNSNRQAIVDALEKRPNQAPLIAALEATLSVQMRNKMRAQAAQSEQDSSIGINTLPPGVQGSNLPFG